MFPSDFAPVLDQEFMRTYLWRDSHRDAFSGWDRVIPAPDPLPGFLTFYNPGGSIQNLFKLHGYAFDLDDKYLEMSFAYYPLREGYVQLRLNPLPEMAGKSYDEQKASLPEDEEPVEVQPLVVAMMVMSNFITRSSGYHGTVLHETFWKHHLFTGTRLRCKQGPRAGHRFGLLRMPGQGSSLTEVADDERGPTLGLASQRKLKR